MASSTLNCSYDNSLLFQTEECYSLIHPFQDNIEQNSHHLLPYIQHSSSSNNNNNNNNNNNEMQNRKDLMSLDEFRKTTNRIEATREFEKSITDSEFCEAVRLIRIFQFSPYATNRCEGGVIVGRKGKRVHWKITTIVVMPNKQLIPFSLCLSIEK